MRHKMGYKKLNRTSEHRKALIKNMLTNNGFYLYKDYYKKQLKQGNQIWKKNEQNN